MATLASASRSGRAGIAPRSRSPRTHIILHPKRSCPKRARGGIFACFGTARQFLERPPASEIYLEVEILIGTVRALLLHPDTELTVSVVSAWEIALKPELG